MWWGKCWLSLPNFCSPTQLVYRPPGDPISTIIWEDSHYSSKRCKQRPGWRLWASWQRYSPGWTQSWSLHGWHTGRSSSSGGGPQNHPAGNKSRVLKSQILLSFGLHFCLCPAHSHLCRNLYSVNTPVWITTCFISPQSRLISSSFLNNHSTSSFLLHYLCHAEHAELCFLVSQFLSTSHTYLRAWDKSYILLIFFLPTMLT